MRFRSRNFSRCVVAVLVIVGAFGCTSVPGPDKSAAGAVLGAAWGAGAGAVIGNQMNDRGPGAALGAGFGAASGLMTGVGLDVAEGTQLQQQREIDALEAQIADSQQGIRALQDRMDRHGAPPRPVPSVKIYFDVDRASLRIGAVGELQRFAQSVKRDASLRFVEIRGHSDESGAADRNLRLSEARARSVQNVLAQQGISLDQIRVTAYGANEPVATNATEEGKQLNRRVEVLVVR